ECIWIFHSVPAFLRLLGQTNVEGPCPAWFRPFSLPEFPRPFGSQAGIGVPAPLHLHGAGTMLGTAYANTPRSRSGSQSIPGPGRSSIGGNQTHALRHAAPPTVHDWDAPGWRRR